MIKFKPFENLENGITRVNPGTFFKIVNDEDPEKIYLQLTTMDYYDIDEEEVLKSPRLYGHKTIPLDVDIHAKSCLEEQVKLKNFHEKYQDVRIFIPCERIILEEEKDCIPCGEFFKTENNNIIIALTNTLYFDFIDCNVHNYSEITGDLEMLDVEIFYGPKIERGVKTDEWF